MPLCRTFCHGLEIHDFGLQQNGIKQFIDAVARMCRDVDELLLAAPFLRNDFVLRQLILDALRIGIFAIDLVDCHDHRHAGRLRVLNRLDRLWHDAVIGGDDQNDDVRRLCAASTHGRKGGVSRRIQERDLPLSVSPSTRQYAA